MKLSKKQRTAIVQAIRSNVSGERLFKDQTIGNVDADTYFSRMLSLAARIEMSTEMEKDGEALKYLPCLPYTLPDVFDGGKGEMERMGVLLSAYYVCNDYSHHFKNLKANDAAARMMTDLS